MKYMKLAMLAVAIGSFQTTFATTIVETTCTQHCWDGSGPSPESLAIAAVLSYAVAGVVWLAVKSFNKRVARRLAARVGDQSSTKNVSLSSINTTSLTADTSNRGQRLASLAADILSRDKRLDELAVRLEAGGLNLLPEWQLERAARDESQIRVWRLEHGLSEVESENIDE